MAEREARSPPEALSETARQRVGDLPQRRPDTVAGPWPTGDRVLVCVSEARSPGNATIGARHRARHVRSAAGNAADRSGAVLTIRLPLPVAAEISEPVAADG